MFDAVGGLNKQIRALKEMVLFPLMYPEVFEKFKISPPRGVLFHGPPGIIIISIYFFVINKLVSSSMKHFGESKLGGSRGMAQALFDP